MEQNNGTVIDRGCSGVLRMKRRHLKAGMGRDLVGNDGARDTLGSVDGGLVSMLRALHGRYIWV
jgi:hypothetical protein